MNHSMLTQTIELLEQMSKYAKKRCIGIGAEDHYQAREVIIDIAERLIETSTDLQASAFALENTINSISN